MRTAVGVSIVLLAVGSTAHAQEPAVTGACAKPDSVAFVGNVRVAESALRGDVGIAPGTDLSYRTLQRAIKNLYATAQFDDIQVRCQVVGGRALLTFAV